MAIEKTAESIMAIMCPISFARVDERAVQINAALVVLCVLLFLTTDQKWLIFILAADFLIRGFLNPAFSPLGAVGKTFLRFLDIQPVMVNAGPKLFAAKIGFCFCCGIAIAHFTGHGTVSVVLGGILAFFAGLEAVFRFCVACTCYPIVCRFRPGRKGKA